MHRFKITICLLLTILNVSTMLHTMATDNNESLFETLHLELQDEIVNLVVYTGPNIDIDINSFDNATLGTWLSEIADKLYFPIKDLGICLVSKKFYQMSKNNFFKILYKVTLKLSTLNLESRKNLVSVLRADKESTPLALALFVTSFLSNNIETLKEFQKAYAVVVQSIMDSVLSLNTLARFCTNIPKEAYKRIRFRPNRVRNIKLLKLILNNLDITGILTKKPFDSNYLIRIIKHLTIQLRYELFGLLKDKDIFKKYFLDTSFKQTIFDQNVELVKSTIATDYEITPEVITPLILAILMNNKEIVQLLLEHETEISKYNDYRALYYAATTKNNKIFELLVHTCHMPEKEYQEALLYATASENIQVLQFFIDNKLISSTDKNTLLMFLEYASVHDLEEIAKFFAPIMTKFSFSLDWLLRLALKRNSLAVASIYLLNGANNNENYYSGKNSLLHMACALGNLAMVKLLVEHHAAIDSINDDLVKPVDLATAHGYTEIVAYLDVHKAQSSSLKASSKKRKKCLVS